MDPKAKVKGGGSISAVIIRADGRREDLGMISSTKMSDRVRIWFREGIRKMIKR